MPPGTNRRTMNIRIDNPDQQNNQSIDLNEVIKNVIKMTNEKKVTKQNAFDAEIITQVQMKQFLEQNENMEAKWLRTGEAVGANANIYGCRVENVYNETYKISGAIGRGVNNQDDDLGLLNDEED